MLRNCSLAPIATFAFAATRFQSPVASALTIGGWTATRGGDSGILAGDDFAAMRNDLSAYFLRYACRINHTHVHVSQLDRRTGDQPRIWWR